MKEIYVSTSDIAWQPAEAYPDGAMQKMLHDGSGSTPLSFLLKTPPGWTMEEHSHVHTEIHYVLEGEYRSHGKVYPAGSFRMIPAHTNHGPFTTPGGAVVLVLGIHEVP